jgi:beta-glucosidase
MHEDVALLAELGADAYRFSIAWPRVVPLGTGSVSTSGLAFYSELVDALLDVGVEPVATLYHWDLPQPLEDLGGWPARDTASAFADYAAIVGAALGDRVQRWSTVNEPWCSSMLGYAAGVHAPGRTEPGIAVAAAHHLLLGHGLAVDALRATGHPLEVAITLNPYPVVAEGSRDADIDAARRVDGVANRLWFDAVLRGQYPEDVLADFAAVSSLAHIKDGDLDQIARPLDALGVNYYRRHHVRATTGASATGASAQWPGSPDVELVDPPGPRTAGGWAIEPDGLREVLVDLASAGDAPPLYVHEAGAAFHDAIASDGTIDDEGRISWLEAHVDAALDAAGEGVDLRGFFVWSLLDNFEWAEGYGNRFGIVRVDFDSLTRAPKRSAGWFREVARRR